MSEPVGAHPAEDVLLQAVEAVIFASGEPVDPREIAAAFEGIAVERIERAIEELREQYERTGGGLRLEKVAGGFRVATRPEVGAWVRRFFRQRNRTRLSPAAFETLAIVAYRQPVTAPEVQAIRGKDPAGPLKSLLEKKLIRILGKKKVVGRPLIYGTTRQFLMHFGLDSLEELPTIAEFEEFVEAFESAAEKAAGEPLDDAEEAGEGTADGERSGETVDEGSSEPDEDVNA